MTKKTLMIFATIVVAVLFSFTTFAQDEATGGNGKITYDSLQAQNKKLEGLRTSYNQIRAEYSTECTGKTFTAGDEAIKRCEEKSIQLTNLYNEMKKEKESYNRNIERYKANNAEASPDAIGASSQKKPSQQ